MDIKKKTTGGAFHLKERGKRNGATSQGQIMDLMSYQPCPVPHTHLHTRLAIFKSKVGRVCCDTSQDELLLLR